MRESWDEERLKKVYEYIQMAHKGEVSKKVAIELAAVATNGKTSSIGYQFAAFEAMLKGKSWSIGINTSNIELFLSYIEKEYGTEKLKNALIATKKHLLYKGKWGQYSEKQVLVKRIARRNGIDIDKN